MSTLSTLALIAWQAAVLLNYSDPIPEVPQSDESSAHAVQQLQHDIGQLLNTPSLQTAQVGIKVISLANGETLYSKDAEKLYHPASTMKLITSATALTTLSPNYRFQTTLYTDPQQASNAHNLYLKGRGDPCFSSDDLFTLVEQMKIQGITEVTGNIIVDESYLDSNRRGRGWMWDDGPFGGYYSELSALSINNNGIVVRVNPGNKVGSPVTVTTLPPTGYLTIVNQAKTTRSTGNLDMYLVKEIDNQPRNTLVVSGNLGLRQAPISQHVDITNPAMYAGTLLAEQLTEQGIEFTGEIQRGKTPDNAKMLSTHQSPRLADVAHHMNKTSDNLSAELVLKVLGAEQIGTPGTASKGITVINTFLEDIGLNPRRYTLADGSGVSRYNLVTADMLTYLLQNMFQNFAVMPEFFSSLAVAGTDGTLSRRMLNNNTLGILRAKTGTMQGISTLAGYISTSDHELLAFTIMISHYSGPARAVRSVQDQLGQLLANFSRS